MAVKTIFAITGATSFVGTDEFELQLASGGASKKVSGSNLRKQLFAGGTGFTATDPLNCGAIAATGDNRITKSGASSVPAFIATNSTGGKDAYLALDNSTGTGFWAANGVGYAAVIWGHEGVVLGQAGASPMLKLLSGTATFFGAVSGITTLDATSSIKSSGPINGIGYATGAGGTVTQLTSKATGVTLNKVCGRITLAADALAAGATVSFSWNNSAITGTDIVHVMYDSGTAGAYKINVRCGSGAATVDVTNTTAGSLSEALAFAFIVFKTVTS